VVIPVAALERYLQERSEGVKKGDALDSLGECVIDLTGI